MSRLLIDEYPLQVLPSLAVAIGLNESMFIQQLHFWLGIAQKSGSGRIHDGQVWSYKTFEEWQQENFPFWGISTIKRLVDKLTKSGLILVERLDQHRRVQTNFYTINYAKLNEICRELKGKNSASEGDFPRVSKRPDPECQSDTMESAKVTRPRRSDWNDLTEGTETTSETTTENISSGSQTDTDECQFSRFWLIYPSTPRRVAKAKCREAWNKNKLHHVADDIIEHVRAMKATKQWKDGYEPAPLTYINQRRWEDGLPDPALEQSTLDRSRGNEKPTAFDQGMAAAERAKARIFGDGHASQ